MRHHVWTNHTIASFAVFQLARILGNFQLVSMSYVNLLLVRMNSATVENLQLVPMDSATFVNLQLARTTFVNLPFVRMILLTFVSFLLVLFNFL